MHLSVIFITLYKLGFYLERASFFPRCTWNKWPGALRKICLEFWITFEREMDVEGGRGERRRVMMEEADDAWFRRVSIVSINVSSSDYFPHLYQTHAYAIYNKLINILIFFSKILRVFHLMSICHIWCQFMSNVTCYVNHYVTYQSVIVSICHGCRNQFDWLY